MLSDDPRPDTPWVTVVTIGVLALVVGIMFSIVAVTWINRHLLALFGA